MIITEQGQMIRMAVKDVRVIGRSTQGVRLINLDEGDLVVSATSVEPDDEDSAGNTPPVLTEEPPAG
jgi:DNA gyrase subunit A